MASAKKNEKKGGAVGRFFTKVFGAIGRFFKGIGSELKKVTWPTGKELFKTTVSVLVVCIVIGALIFGVDSLLQFLVGLVR